MADASGLVTTIILNREIIEVENKHTCSWRDKLIILWTLNSQAKVFSRKVPDTSSLVTTTVRIQKLLKLRIKFLV